MSSEEHNELGKGLSPGIGEFSYLGNEPNLVPGGHELYLLGPKHIVEKRQHSRISSRNAQACIRTEEGVDVIVQLVNISRRGACFTSSNIFDLGTQVSIATHYFAGGQNIFQVGQIVRIQCRPTATLPGRYALKF